MFQRGQCQICKFGYFECHALVVQVWAWADTGGLDRISSIHLWPLIHLTHVVLVVQATLEWTYAIVELPMCR